MDGISTSMLNHIFFLLRTAWRDTRGSRAHLTVYGAALALGIAALVTSLGARSELTRIVDLEARALLGADASVRGKDEVDSLVLKDLEPQASAREIRFRSMAAFSSGLTRLVQVRAVESGYPYYGNVETSPQGLWSKLPLDPDGVLVEESLLLQAQARVGDRVKIGRLELVIRGAVTDIPESSNVSSVVAPRLYMHYDTVRQTGLVSRNSLADYFLHLKLHGAEVESALAKLEQSLPSGFTLDTVADRRSRLGSINDNALLFFSLVGLACLSLGAIGAASSLYFYLRSKMRDAAILKCLGLRSRDVVVLYSFQLLLTSFAASAVGGALAVALFAALAELLSGIFATPLRHSVPWGAVLAGFAVGLGTIAVAGAPGALLLRRTPALMVLRGQSVVLGKRARALIGAAALLVAPLTLQLFTTGPSHGLLYGMALNAVVALLLLVSFAIRKCVASLGGTLRSFPVRFGLLSLSRPRNATLALMSSFSLTVILAGTLVVTRDVLRSQVELVKDENTANLFIYDVQEEQVPEVRSILARHGISLAEEVPIVLMRITRIGDTEVSAIIRDEDSKIPAWTLRRDYWSTYRSQVLSNERIVSGKWVERVAPDVSSIPISIEDRLAERLAVSVGDRIDFDVQGVPFVTRIASLRKIYWEQMRRNAFVVFPEGVLEDAPKFLFLTAHTPNAQVSGVIQRELVQAFPGISIVDISSVVDTIFGLLEKIARALAVLSALVLCTACAVLLGAVWSSRGIREKESALLRTLGATRLQVKMILLIEYCAISIVAALLGLGIATALGALLAHYGFRAPFSVPWLDLILVGVGTVVVVCAFAWVFTRRIFSRPLDTALRSASS